MIFSFFLILISFGFFFLLLGRKKTGSFFILLAGLLSYSVGNGVFASFLLKELQTKPYFKPVHWKSRNTIIVLGGGILQSSLKQDQIRCFALVYSRLFEAARLYEECKKQGKNCVILATGGDPHRIGVSEAEIMKKELVGLGISESSILLEKKSNNTYQNAQFSSAILEAKNTEAYLLVTSGFHMSRALLYFFSFGVPVLAYPSDELKVRPSFTHASYHFFLSELALHEWIGILRFSLFQQLGWNHGSSQPGAF